jgi:hypothetical protein
MEDSTKMERGCIFKCHRDIITKANQVSNIITQTQGTEYVNGSIPYTKCIEESLEKMEENRFQNPM